LKKLTALHFAERFFIRETNTLQSAFGVMPVGPHSAAWLRGPAHVAKPDPKGEIPKASPTEFVQLGKEFQGFCLLLQACYTSNGI